MQFARSVHRSITFAIGALFALVGTAAYAEESPAQGQAFQGLDQFVGQLNAAMASVFFYPVPVGAETTVPLAVAVLVLAAIFFTLRAGLPQLRAFGHAIDVVRGKYDDPEDEGEVSSFQALTSALSATVGLGNIAGVAIAVSSGGPGAVFWMICAGFLGMASKFTEVTLALMYRDVRPDGRVMGGGMYYLSKGFAEMGRTRLGQVLAVWFALMCIGASFGGGNSFQVNQSVGAVARVVPFFADYPWVYGLIMAAAVAVVILGGIRRIASTAEKIVPLMCGVYFLAAIVILVMRMEQVPAAFGMIISEAFSPRAGLGGVIGVAVIGFQRAAFSNEAGIGSSAIAHSAAKTPYPVREGIVALLEPFIDTVVVCTVTALVIVVTGAYENPELADLRAAGDGAALTSAAMSEVLPFFPYILAVAVVMFAYSTMISWSYYGERCWVYLFGDGSSIIYKVLFVIVVFLGSVVTAQNVLNFGDLLIFGMVFPNVIGVIALSGKVRAAFDQYMTALKRGDFKVFR